MVWTKGFFECAVYYSLAQKIIMGKVAQRGEIKVIQRLRCIFLSNSCLTGANLSSLKHQKCVCRHHGHVPRAHSSACYPSCWRHETCPKPSQVVECQISVQAEEDHGQVLCQTQAEIAASAMSWVDVFVPLRLGEI